MVLSLFVSLVLFLLVWEGARGYGIAGFSSYGSDAIFRLFISRYVRWVGGLAGIYFYFFKMAWGGMKG